MLLANVVCMRILPSAAGLAVIGLLLVGCVPDVAAPDPTPTPTSAPVFASDEEALAAAEAAYAAYQEASADVFSAGGQGAERLRNVATGEFLAESTAGFERVAEEGWVSVGSPSFDSVELQQFKGTGVGEGAVVVYLCDDVSDVDVLDLQGASVVSGDRPDRTRFEVTFDAIDPGDLLISSRQVWGDGSC